MNWITLSWPMAIAACFTLAMIHAQIAFRLPGRARAANGFFTLSAVAVALTGCVELTLLHTHDLETYRLLMRWAQAPICVMIVSLAGFILNFFGTGRRGLALAAGGLATLVLVANSLAPGPYNVRHAVGLETVESFGGVLFTLPHLEGGWLSLFETIPAAVLMVFVVDASLALRRQGQRLRAAVVGGSIVFALLVSRGYALLVEEGVVRTPFFFVFPYLALLLAMGRELSLDIHRATQLAEQLHESELRTDRAARAAKLEADSIRRELEHVSRVTTLGELSASMAHELNQPLAAILSNAQAARRFLAAPVPDLGLLREILDDIIADDKRAGEVVHRLRALVKRRDHAEAQDLDLDELVRDVERLLHTELVSRNLACTMRLAGSLPPVRAGRVEIQQVLLNLMVNAMDALREAGAEAGEITVSTAATATHARVGVRDNGPGVPADILPRIFEPFFTTKAHGLGMGLAICRTIIEAAGGRLWVESPPGGGACFLFELPTSPPAA